MRNFTLVVFFVGLMGLVDMVGITVLAVQSHPIPDPLTVALASIIGGLIGLLAQPGRDTPPNP